MKLIEPSFQIEQAPPYHDMLATIERAARTCYQSEGKIKEGSAEKLIRVCINRGHHSILEHCSITVRIICDRGVSHELVRHRLCAFSQESQRYCAYKGDVEFIRPYWLDGSAGTRDLEKIRLSKHTACSAIRDAERYYQDLLEMGVAPQNARAVLPNATKTEIVITANIREWRHIFKLRCSNAAHPEMRRIMLPMRKEFANRWPVFFEDLMF
jgi:thymidylate synthase (FAD)